jgi:biofilm PGA synthesis N-glycosyltransferase PgaC
MESEYVCITPARNEELCIEKTIRSVISQTILPTKWVIVSDGSKDRTDNIVRKYEIDNEFIRLVRRESGARRNFSSKAHAFQTGFQHLTENRYKFIVNIDADVSLEPNYFKCILEKFRDNPKLGIAGGLLFEHCDGKWIPWKTSTSWSVGGAVQMFRRQCFEDIGGYLPLKKGGIDAIAEVMARMRGWQVKSFKDIQIFHHKRTGTKNEHILKARVKQGIMEYSHGYHPFFELMKCFYRIDERPYVLGSVFRLWGYVFAFSRGDQPAVPVNVIDFLRKEQMQRLRSFHLM